MSSHSLSKSEFPLNPDPFQQFESWYQDAIQTGMKNPNAMTLATASPNGIPTARIVLYKGADARGVRFFTNFQSIKGQELEANPHAALVFYWSTLDRQVRIEGSVEKISPDESDTYWKSRPRASQIGSLISPQSQVIPNRKTLEDHFDQIDAQFEDQPIPRPANWGGFRLIPERFEFWMAGDARLHDRFSYWRNKAEWKAGRLAP